MEYLVKLELFEMTMIAKMTLVGHAFIIELLDQIETEQLLRKNLLIIGD